ncbi:electron transport complex subunit RsxG [Shewanella sp. C32]|uniref:Ion-translocating oxidoreductase complex subunit G n=1 Tax=Shewanella electrica TaxID=515560 RepID=A0ABT2FU01_9GAMM|nr:electron transport complex subunit RsxG [Shewanella electrica]MCH1926999.1 electron transport complex subunit RsxG [Shewanella electrica]MCS4558646.1 electron transport complex subunit RsxG [Shewanella electrica]
MKNSMLKNGLLLGLFALVCSALVAGVNLFTAPQISYQQRQQLLGTLHQIIPDSIHDNDLAASCRLITAPEALGTRNAMPVYVATKLGEPQAAALETIAPDGYNGNIHIIVAVNNDGVVLGVRTLEQQETPGLGDKVELRKSSWVDEFAGKLFDINNLKVWFVKKDGGAIDQFTGATITPRAYTKALRNTLSYFMANKQQIYASSTPCEEAKL